LRRQPNHNRTKESCKKYFNQTLIYFIIIIIVVVIIIIIIIIINIIHFCLCIYSYFEKFRKKNLAQNWPSLEKKYGESSDNSLFWNEQWTKHGKCSLELFDADEYFVVALKIYGKFQVTNYLQAEGIVPSDNKQALVNAIEKHIFFQATNSMSSRMVIIYLK